MDKNEKEMERAGKKRREDERKYLSRIDIARIDRNYSRKRKGRISTD